MWISEKRFWKIVKVLDWKNNSEKCFETLLYFIVDINEIDTIKQKAVQKREALGDVIKAHEKLNIDVPRVWGGDDSFWDVRAHIVGLGEKVFNECLVDIQKIVIAENYIENFEYTFSRAEEFAETEEGKYLLTIPLKEKELMYIRKRKLNRIL